VGGKLKKDIPGIWGFIIGVAKTNYRPPIANKNRSTFV
jgi:hypothetical protein